MTARYTKNSRADRRRRGGVLPAGDSQPTSPIVRWSPPLAVVLLTTLAFLPTLQNGFVNWDDERNFVENVHYRGLGWTQLRWMFTTFHLGPYQPLSWVTLGLDYLLWGMNPVGYHLTSLLLHAANAVVFSFLTRDLLRLTMRKSLGKGETALSLAAGFAALVFALHPLRVESVAWATERRDVLSGLFFLLTLLCYLRAATAPEADPTRPRWLAAAVSVYALSLLSKATGMTLPIILLVLDVYPLRRLGGGPGRWVGPEARRVWWEKIPFLVFALMAGGIALVGQYQAGAMRPLTEAGVVARVAQASFGLTFYLWKTLVPLDLSPLYPLPVPLDPLEPPFLLSGAVVLALSGGLLALRHRWPAGLAIWVSYLVMLLPVSGLVQIGPQIAADRYTYLPSLGWAVLAGAGLLHCWQGGAIHRRTAALLTGLAAGVVVALGVLTWQQVQVWRDSERLWRHTLAVGYPSSIAHYNLALTLDKEERVKEAIRHYREALRIRPAYVDAHFNLGNLLARHGQLDEAADHYREALRIRPDFAKAHNNLGIILGQQGRLDEAMHHYRQALETDPAHADAFNNLGNVFARQGKLEEAIEHYRKALEINPASAKTHNNLGNALARLGKLDEAIKYYREALQLDPAYAEAHYNFGLALGKLGRLDEAMASYQAALDVAPKDWAFRQVVQSKLTETRDKVRKGK